MKNRIIYLAGGNSSRFSENKLLYTYLGKPLFRHTFDKLYSIVQRNENYSLLVISQYLELLDSISEDVQKVYCPDCKKGASYTIRNAIEALEKEEGYDTFVVADQPFLKEETLDSFMKEVLRRQPSIACVSYQNEWYNPVMFHTSLEEELCELEGDQGGKRVVKRHADQVFSFEIKNAEEIKDIDTWNDVEG